MHRLAVLPTSNWLY